MSARSSLSRVTPRGIYKIGNSANDKVYIGKSLNIMRRWGEHLSHLTSGTHYCGELQSLFTDHGPSVFTFEIVEIVEAVVGIEHREKFWIDHFHRKGQLMNVMKMDGRKATYSIRISAEDADRLRALSAVHGLRTLGHTINFLIEKYAG